MKVTRHNGRSGKHGVYNPKHNDRQFDVAKSEHIDAARSSGNINLDYQREYRSLEEDGTDGISFEDVELDYYRTHYGDYIRNQNARNEMQAKRSIEDWFLYDIERILGFLMLGKNTKVSGKNGYDKFQRLYKQANKIQGRISASGNMQIHLQKECL